MAVGLYLIFNKFFPAEEAQVEMAIHDLVPGAYESEMNPENPKYGADPYDKKGDYDMSGVQVQPASKY